MSGSVGGSLNASGLLEDHLHKSFLGHPLEGLSARQGLLLVDFMKMFDFFAPLVFFSEVAHVAINLLLSLLDALSDLTLHLPRLFLLHSVDLGEALLVADLLRIHCHRFDLFLSFLAHLLHLGDLLTVAL